MIAREDYDFVTDFVAKHDQLFTLHFERNTIVLIEHTMLSLVTFNVMSILTAESSGRYDSLTKSVKSNV